MALLTAEATALAERHEKAQEPALFSASFILASAEAIDLTAAQKDAIDALVRARDAAQQEANRELQRNSDQLLELLSAPQADANAVSPLLDEILARESAAKKAEILYLIKLRSVLSQEQREKLTALQASPARETKPAPSGGLP